MYDYLNKFVKDWKDEDLLRVLGRLPEHELVGDSWARIISAVGVDGFMRLAMTMPGAEIQIPSLFQILTVLSAECIVEKAKTMPLEDAKQLVLGKLELNEVNVLVDRLRTDAASAEAVADTES